MTEVVAEKAPKKEVVRTLVEMEDGRKVEFAGKRKMSKDVLIDRAAGTVQLRIDLLNGKTVYVKPHPDLALETLGHGLSQKVGDEVAGVDDVDDMHLALVAAADQHHAGKWSSRVAGEGGGFSGASVVIRAIMEATGKDQTVVKAFLDGKIAAAEAKGEKLTRQELYKSFRNPNSKTGQIILRLEQEKADKTNKINSDDLLTELDD